MLAMVFGNTKLNQDSQMYQTTSCGERLGMFGFVVVLVLACFLFLLFLGGGNSSN